MPDRGEGRVELRLAIAFQRAEDLARDAFRMNANENVRARAYIAPHQGYVLLRDRRGRCRPAHCATKYVRLEITVACRDPGFRQALGRKPLRPDHPLGDVHLNSVFFLDKFSWR